MTAAMTWTWYAVRCTARGCRWSGTRQADSAAQARQRSCPRCGADVVAAQTRPPGLGRIRFRQEGV